MDQPITTSGRRTLLARTAAVSMVLVFSLAGCGSSSAPTAATSNQATAKSPKQIFTSAGCAGCHTLAAADATGSVGPNLDELKPSYAAAVTQITRGGGVMPSFAKTLSKLQIRLLAKFIVAATHGGG